MATKPRDFGPPPRIEVEYYRSIKKLIEPYFENITGPESILRAFVTISQDKTVIEEIAAKLASRMITQVRATNARSWREGARQASRGREIYNALHFEMGGAVGRRVHQIVGENAMLIGSIPSKIREMVNNEISERERTGQRPEQIASFLRMRLPQLTRHQAALIARTETGKSATALTRARAESLNINWYQWATSEDSRVRPSHRKMDKVLVSWGDPPSPERLIGEKSALGHYHAGGAPNCRCDSWPVISLNHIAWPATVYLNGSLRRMTRAQFADFSGIAVRRAA